ncbi:sulfatase [Cerasicoccus frondis]|uniref:sulfatase n=1 Tax=Cerasicoccus frondis TaxID=490090 RepID=UPI002852B5BE|nr:sulfatase [Cerasicoccus frondis]
MAKASDPAIRPNVLLIAIDDLNDWVEPLGGYQASITPNIQRLASMGMCFENAHSNMASCIPSRNSMLTGRHPANIGFINNAEIVRLSRKIEGGLGQYLPGTFKEGGYATYGTGKIFHEDYCDNATVPKERLWTDWGMLHTFGPVFPFQKADGSIIKAGFGRPMTAAIWYHEVTPEDFDRKDAFGLNVFPKGKLSDEANTDWAVSRIQAHHGNEPFMLACGLAAPHVPLVAPKEFFELYDLSEISIPEIPEDEMSDVPVMGKFFAYGHAPTFDDMRRFIEIDWSVGEVIDYDYWKKIIRAYLACITYADHAVGRLLDTLEKTPDPRVPEKKLIDTTIIVLYSDHGWHLGEKMHWHKQALWEESTRVPLIWRVPGVTKPGTMSEVPVCLLDIYPTLMALCDLPEVLDLDGVDLSPLLANPSMTLEREMIISTWYWNSHAVRSERWRLIRYGDGSMELYDHAVDPGEHDNLLMDPDDAENYAPIVETHLEALRRYPSTELDQKAISAFEWQCRRAWGEAGAPPLWLQ